MNQQGNGLKYTTVTFKCHDGKYISLTPNDDRASKDRWNDVLSRPHVFQISKEPNINGTMGRPPHWNEDYCPNCYEILQIVRDYKHCSGCLQPMISIDRKRREICMYLYYKK